MVRSLSLCLSFVLVHLCQAAVYTSDWAVRIKGDLHEVNATANKYGFTNMGQIGDLTGYYSFRQRETARRSSVSNEAVTAVVATETQVEWLQQQVLHRRVKRASGEGAAPSLRLDDPARSSLWYLHCGSRTQGCMNIAAAWGRGYTGKGVVLSVLDDGVDREHPDLKPNYDPLASYDLIGRDPDPSPGHAHNDHGTRCAGTATAANNSRCTVGVSFGTRVGGVRFLDGDVSDMTEAHALSLRPQHIDVYLAGWGPEDDGATVEGPGPLAQLALHNGIKTGRGGRGSVYVWASGNGGRRGDHCSCDGYGGSIYTVSVSSCARSGNAPPQLERCASTLTAAAAHSGPHAMSPGLDGSCGRAPPPGSSSLAASVAAGVIALTLEANPSLTWRDVQHLIVRTSNPRHLIAPDWSVNAAGYKVSHLYGFGLLDAEAMVKEAERWKPVPPQHRCVEAAPMQQSRAIHPGSAVSWAREATGCLAEPGRRVAHVEHVVARVTIAHGRRGDLSITLTSPSGTVSQLLENRPLDSSTQGFHNWELMTTHCWGERAAGQWRLEIKDTPSPGRRNTEAGMLKEWSLVIYGTAEQPYATHRQRARSAETPTESDLIEEYAGPCDPECSDDGCEGPGPQHCVTCAHFFLKFKNGTRLCVPGCPKGFWGDRRRCKRCFSSCESCTGSRSDQCTACRPGHHLTEGASTCTAACPDHFYLDHDADVCRKCGENCAKCTSSSICTECSAGTSLQGNRCQRSCAAGSYLDKQGGTCAPCHQACATCAGAGVEACNLCAEGYLLEEWRCVSSCSASFYAAEAGPQEADGQRMCRRCDASCLTCVGPSRGNCSGCSGGHRLQEGVCVVDTACTDGEFQDGHGNCNACDATCLKCTGPRSQDCISCVASRVLEEGQCVLECAKGKYQSGGRCHLCDHTCATCVDGAPASCTSCDTDKFGMERYLHRGGCVDACPEAFYHTAGRTCAPCAAHCRLCTGPAHCLSCNSSYYAAADGACVKLECGEGEVEDPDYDECMVCEQGCAKCVLYNPRHCLSCTEGFYNFQDGCYRNCPAKTYSVERDMSCVACDHNCVSCDEHECYWCEADLFLSEGRCVAACPRGFYGDQDTNDCEECHADCATCDGPEDADCLSCAEEGAALDHGACVSEPRACPARTFLTDDGECYDCHPSCESCSGEQMNECTSCAQGLFLSAQQTCVARCPAGSFASRPSGACAPCPPGCLQCADAQRCTRCQSTRRAPLFLQDGQCVQQCVRGFPLGQVCRSCSPGCASCARNATHCLSCAPPLLLHAHRCVELCPPAHAAHAGQCQRCPAACRECDALGLCSECEQDRFLLEGGCVPECPAPYYPDAERGECGRCHAHCSGCDGPGADDCDACADPDAALHGGECLAPCPAHSYRDALTGECRECDASCLSCLGPRPDSCTGCSQGRRLEGHGRCVPHPATPPAPECQPHQYSEGHGECRPCHKHCSGCSGPGSAQCLSCSHGHFLLNGTCVDRCPPGYFQDAARCERCHASCQTCAGGGRDHDCLTCRPQLFWDGKACAQSCRHGYYGNEATGRCERCAPSCGECAGGQEDGCLSCAPGLRYVRREGRCLADCPQGYHHQEAHHTCEPCHATCRTCSGKDSASCDSCYTGFLLSDGTCESLCDIGQFPVMKQRLGYTCDECDSSCLECRGPGPTNCTMCPVHAILEAGGRCLLCCRHDDEDEAETSRRRQQDCCNCTESRGECVVSSNLAFTDEEEEEVRGNLTVFIIACVLLVLALGAVVFIIRHSRSKRAPPDITPRGYEKLGGGGFGYGSSSYGGRAGSSSGGGRFQETQLVDLGGHRSHAKAEDEDDDDEDIVYMGKDGTVYRKFRYGQLGHDKDDELEYDDESYAFR